MSDQNRKYRLLIRPWTAEEVYKATKEGTEYLTVIISLDLHEIACSSSDGSLDGLNELADREIGHCLSDLTYKVVGVEFDHTGKSTNKIHIEVTGDPQSAIEEHLEQIQDENPEHEDVAN